MHPEQNDSIMVITKQVQEILDATPPGKVLTIADFNVLPEYQPALVKALQPSGGRRLYLQDCQRTVLQA